MCFKMKKLFAGGNKKTDRHPDTTSDKTIDRIVSKKEEQKLKWQKQQDEFDRRKREHQMNLVEMERKEVQRREEELRQRKDLLEEKKRKHAKIENDIIEQRQTLIEKLENYKIEHQDKENDIVNEISRMNKKKDEVKSNLDTRTRELGLIFEIDETDYVPKTDMAVEHPVLHELRRSCSVPSEPNTPDCDVFQDCNPLNQSYSTLTVDKGMIKFENSATLLEENIDSLSNDEVDSSSNSGIEKLSAQGLETTRGYSPPPNYNDVNEWGNKYITTKRASSEVNTEENQMKHSNGDYHCTETQTKSEAERAHSDETETDDIVFRPSEEVLPATPIKRKSASFNWKSKRDSKPKVRTKRLYGTSGADSDRDERTYSRANAPNFCFASSFLDPKQDKSFQIPSATNFTKLKPVGNRFRKKVEQDFMIPELSSSSSLQHLVKTRPKRRKKYAPIKKAVLT